MIFTLSQRRNDTAAVDKLLNRAGTTFRQLPDADKADLDQAKAVIIAVGVTSAGTPASITMIASAQDVHGGGTLTYGVSFDFDGTLTRGESFFRFLRHVTPLPRFVAAFVLSAPTLVSYLLGWKDNETAKVIVLRHFLRGRPLTEVAPLADDFARKVIPRTVRPEALAGLRGHQKQGHVSGRHPCQNLRRAICR